MISFPTRFTTSLGSTPILTNDLAIYFCLNLAFNFLINQIYLQIIHYLIKNLLNINQQILVANAVNYWLNWIEVGKLIIGKGEIVR